MSSDSTNNNKAIFLYSYPKIIFLYPTFFSAFLAGLLQLLIPEAKLGHDLIGIVFMWILALNLVVLAFDFPRSTSLSLFFFLMAIGLGLWLLFLYNRTLLPFVYNILSVLRPTANTYFYFTLSTILGAIFVAVFALIRFDFWEIRPNELLHHHGIMSNLERYSAPNLRITKEIDDVFEYMLLRSGRLILDPAQGTRPFVLENVPFIDQRESEITRMLGALQVQVRTDTEQ